MPSSSRAEAKCVSQRDTFLYQSETVTKIEIHHQRNEAGGDYFLIALILALAFFASGDAGNLAITSS